jgi:predicted nucleotidyltransferase
MPLNKQEETALKQFKANLKQVLGSQLIELNLFGSKARGDDHHDSDIDVLVIVAGQDWRICDTVYDIATDILLQTNVCISPKVISESKFCQLREEGAPFIRNMDKDVIVV